MPRANAQGAPEGDTIPGFYNTVREFHQRELARLNSLDDVVYELLKRVEAPAHQEWLRRMRNGQPALVPVWAVTDFDGGAAGLSDWVREARGGELLVWPDDRITPAPSSDGSQAWVDPGFYREPWTQAGHTPRWPLGK
jgi:hypothetical protein